MIRTFQGPGGFPPTSTADVAYQGFREPVRKRPRGRPPTETRDRTTIDRRRAQNRQAQRAYRQRKETAIETLQRRIRELEGLNEEIGRQYTSFTDLLLRQKAFQDSPDIVRHVREITKKMLYIARHREEVSSNSSGVDMTRERSQEQSCLADDAGQRFGTWVSTSGSKPVPSSRLAPKTSESHHLAADPTGQSVRATPPDLSTTPQVDSPVQPSSRGETFSFPALDTQTRYSFLNSRFPGASFASTLRPPMSYAAQEHTFGRRLHRASQEAGFLLASMKSPPLICYLRVFGFCLHFETKDEICSRMSESLRQAKDHTLNVWRYPFTNLGGTGLWYPSAYNENPASGGLPVGNRYLEHEAYRPRELTGLSMGPFSKAIEEVRDLRLNPQLRILDPEFQGDFFDCDEVEIFLRDCGVTIPPNKDFVTTEIDMAIFQDDPDPIPITYDSSGLANFENPLVPPQISESLPLPAIACGSKKTTVKVDIERLITSLVTVVVCMGRTPAVRPQDIRKSLRQSLISID